MEKIKKIIENIIQFYKKDIKDRKDKKVKKTYLEIPFFKNAINVNYFSKSVYKFNPLFQNHYKIRWGL